MFQQPEAPKLVLGIGLVVVALAPRGVPIKLPQLHSSIEIVHEQTCLVFLEFREAEFEGLFWFAVAQKYDSMTRI